MNGCSEALFGGVRQCDDSRNNNDLPEIQGLCINEVIYFRLISAAKNIQIRTTAFGMHCVY